MRKYLIYSLCALFCTIMTFSSCSKSDDEESSSNSTTTRTVSVGLYSTVTGELVGYSTTTATKVNGRNTLSCVEKDLDGKVINEYTMENASDLAVDLIGSWKLTSWAYTDDKDASENESFVCDSQNYSEALITAKTAIERVFEGGKLTKTGSANYALSGSTFTINGIAKQIAIESDVMTLTFKDSDPKEGRSGTIVYKYSRK
ncbi:MAG: hypothetical protein J6T70_07940 [Bacteroidales bacterium]|nr:hypothetical protein [Bacteroidales bacterium]